MVYELDTRGATALRELGHAVPAKTYHYNFAHELMVCRILASIELGARDAGARLIEWPEIYEKLPEEMKVLDESHVIKGYKRPDSKPFGIHADAYYFFAGIEADCGTEPINTSDLDRSSIHAKFLAYAEIARLKLYRTHFGFPNYFVPIVTTTKDVPARSAQARYQPCADGITDASDDNGDGRCCGFGRLRRKCPKACN